MWGPALLLAQVSDPTRATLDNLFVPLDKNQVPTGFLAEDALPLVPLDVFNGTLTDSSRTSPDGSATSTPRSTRLVFMVLSPCSACRTTAPARLRPWRPQGPSIIPVMVQRVDYSTVRPDAFSLNLLAYSNEQVRDAASCF